VDSDTNHGLTLFYTTDGTTPAIFPQGVPRGPRTSTPRRSWWRRALQSRRFFASWDRERTRVLCFLRSDTFPAASRLSVSPQLGRRKTLTSALSACQREFTMVQGRPAVHRLWGLFGRLGELSCPDFAGERVTAWSTSNHKVAVISMGGHVTAMVREWPTSGCYRPLKAFYWTVTVAPAQPSASQPAALQRCRQPPAAARDAQAVSAAATAEVVPLLRATCC